MVCVCGMGAPAIEGHHGLSTAPGDCSLVRSNWSFVLTSLHTAFLDEYMLLQVRVHILVLPSYFSTYLGTQGQRRQW